MKILITLLLAASPLCAGEWGRAENSSAGGLLAAKAEVVTIGGAPLLDLLAARDQVSQPLEIGGVKFLATVVFDANWDTWFLLKPASGLGAGAWKETDLAAGAVYRYSGLELYIKAEKGVVRIDRGTEESKEVSINSLFDKLYADAMKVTFGGLVTYAVFRNLEPLSEEEGTVTLRLGSDGLYYYSVTRDSLVAAAPRWLLAVNGVLYGLLVQDGSLLFVSKKIDLAKPAPPAERVRAR
ncbi:MAG: hypothetical protein A2179_06325 [Elusimicrobia bacterium GWC2_63_65]|nr:MAG: hypothetical protein A2179_06325 [Elusimicrobia bacterium GWC2_63_65]